jgi:hypothetical protein
MEIQFPVTAHNKVGEYHIFVVQNKINQQQSRKTEQNQNLRS